MTTLPDDIFSHSDYFQRFKHALKQKQSQLKEKFNPQQSVKKLLKERSDFIDKLLTVCWEHFLDSNATKLTLCAVGGYGRREMFPYSDIDILILLDSEDDALYKEALSEFCIFLWDIGLKPAHSVRTIQQCVDAAKNDQTIMTSLLEIRLISGHTGQLKTLKNLISPDKIWSSDAFFLAKMQEQRLRYAKFHDTAYNLEPNVKEGLGGLRDRQIIAWVFKRHYNSSTLKELVKYDFLPQSEYQELVDALDILWRIRYALHLLNNRCEDRLIFDYQRDLAKQFGFSRENQHYNQDVELFMQFYFKTVLRLECLNEMLLQLFHERFICKNKQEIVAINDDFIAINGYLHAVDDYVFVRQPLKLLELFLYVEQYPAIQGVSATTIRLIRNHLHLIDDDFRANKMANRLFIEAFRQRNGITGQLRRMNRYGVLSAYLPAFAHITARMQYDLFHIYTVDEHTLFVIRNLRRFAPEKNHDELPFCNDIFLLIPKPELLYIAALFHDIAKGSQGDHSEVGEEIARQFCLQHDLSNADTQLVTWLVRNHLMMSMTAQRKDISDINVVYEFAQKVETVEYLNYLYLLTVADIRATNPELWNSWKDALLKELYASTHKALRKGLQNITALNERIYDIKNEAKTLLFQTGLNEEQIKNAWQHVNDDYFARYSADEIAWHTLAMAQCDEFDLPLVLLRSQTLRGSAEVFVYTKNVGAIFSVSTATLDQLGLTILDARIVTTLDNYVLNSFLVLEQSGEPINEACREAHICSALRHNLLQGDIKATKNIHRQSRQAKHFPIPASVEFHDDLTSRYTVIELITTDHAGLLSKIGQLFLTENINLHSAKITTIGSRVEDMFYVTNQQFQPISDKETLDNLRCKLLEVVTP